MVLVVLQASGCAPPGPPAVVWMNDSSGFVSHSAEFFDVTSGVRSDIALPPREKGFIVRGMNVHPGLKRTVVVAQESNFPLNRPSELVVWVYNGITTPPAKPLRFTVTLSHDPLLPEIDIHQSPTGDHLLVCSLEDAVLIDLKAERSIQPPAITPPYLFERLFAVSPCLPRGEGFLALKRRPMPGEPANIMELHRFLDRHSGIVLVRWDGAVVELGDRTSLARFESLLKTALAPDLEITGTWIGTTLALNTAAGRLEIDPATRTTQMTPAVEGPSPARVNPPPHLPFSELNLADGGCVIQIRAREKRRPVTERKAPELPPILALLNSLDPNNWPIAPQSPRRPDFAVEVVCRTSDNRETVIDDSEHGQPENPAKSPFRLHPSPDRKWAVVNFRERESTYNLLVDRRGDVVDTFGITREEWKSAASRRVKQPVATTHWRFGTGCRFEDGVENEQALKTLRPDLHQTEFLEFAPHSAPLAFSDEGLKSLASMPHLRFLSFPNGLETPADVRRLFSSLPRLEGFAARVSDADLASIPGNNSLQIILLEGRLLQAGLKQQPVRLLTTTALRTLQRFPNLRELEVYGPAGARQMEYDLSSLKQIRRLSIDHGDAVVQLKSLDQMPALRELVLRAPAVSQQTLDEIKLARHLEELAIYGSVNGTIRLDFLRDLKNLKRLTLALVESGQNNGHPAGAPLQGVSLEPLQSLTGLEHLALLDVRVPETEFRALKKLTHLKRARFREIGVSRSAILQLSMAIPKCRLSILPAASAPGQPTNTYQNGGIE